MSEFLKWHKFTSKDDYSSIRCIASRGEIDLFKYFLTTPGVDAMCQCNKSLAWAFGKNHANMLRFLLDISGIEKDDEFLIHTDTAINYGTIDMAKVLLNYPESRGYIKENLKNILQIADRNKNTELIVLLKNEFKD